MIELLVVVAVIALLIALVLPALTQARNSAYNAISLSNLRTHVTSLASYSLDHQGSLFNPFETDPARSTQRRLPDGSSSRWYDVWHPTYETEPWRFDDAGVWRGEMFGVSWASLVSLWMNFNTMFTDAQVSPADVGPKERHERWIESSDFVHNGFEKRPIGDVLFGSSYFYSPTSFFDPGRYRFSFRASSAAENPEQARVKRIRNDEVTTPALKVMFWERFDFLQRSRTAFEYLGFDADEYDVAEQDVQTENARPMWNNPQADVNVALADGSVSRVDMGEQYATWEAMEGGPREDFGPVDADRWAPPANTLAGYGLQDDRLEVGDVGQNTGLYPAWFWTTSNGVRGRDITP